MHTTTRTWRRTAILGITIGLGNALAGCTATAPTTPPVTTPATAATTTSGSAGTVRATVHGTPVTFTLAPGQSAPTDGSAPPDTLLVQGMAFGDSSGSEAHSSRLTSTFDVPVALGEAKNEAERMLATAPTTTP